MGVSEADALLRAANVRRFAHPENENTTGRETGGAENDFCNAMLRAPRP
jgi:hypothetical protein